MMQPPPRRVALKGRAHASSTWEGEVIVTPVGFHELTTVLLKARSLEDIHSACSVLAEDLEFDHFVYGARFPNSFTNPTLVVVSGYPDGWGSWYTQGQCERIDPVLRHCFSEITPIAWDTARAGDYDSRAVRRFMGEARDLGLGAGVSYPLHGRHGEKILLSLAAQRSPAAPDALLLQAAPFAHALLPYVHEAVRKLLNRPEVMLDQIQLTDREKECLLWAAEGKTAWEASRILNISERTVTFHLQNAAEKLHVANRQHAVARAVSLGLIVPQPT